MRGVWFRNRRDTDRGDHTEPNLLLRHGGHGHIVIRRKKGCKKAFEECLEEEGCNKEETGSKKEGYKKITRNSLLFEDNFVLEEGDFPDLSVKDFLLAEEISEENLSLFRPHNINALQVKLFFPVMKNIGICLTHIASPL